MSNSTPVETDLIVATADAVSCDLEGEAVILHLASESYFGLNPAGATIWEFIQEARSFDEICDRLEAEYEVPRDQCEREVRALVEAMRDQGLVKAVQRVR